jgi:hypothetical protein
MNDGFFADGIVVVETHFYVEILQRVFRETHLGREANRARQTAKIGRKRYDLYFSP